MPTSQNGYSANDRSVVASFTVPGTTRKVAIRKGDTSILLLDFAGWFHANIDKIDVGEFDDWGYAERNVRGSTTTLSNHSSGTALDLNAIKHPLGKANTFSASDVVKIRERLALYDGALRWGGDYTSRKDDMHFEINAGAAAVNRVATQIRSGSLKGQPTWRVGTDSPIVVSPTRGPIAVKPAPVAAALSKGSTGDLVANRQRQLNTMKLNVGKIDGDYGDRTVSAVRVVQFVAGLEVDGSIGPKTGSEMDLRDKPNPRILPVDSDFGPRTKAFLQHVLAAPVDGAFDKSSFIALQKYLRVAADGDFGPASVKALQTKVGVKPDGAWGPATTRALQTQLTEGRF